MIVDETLFAKISKFGLITIKQGIMTKQDLINDISRKTGIEKTKVSQTVEAFMDTVKGSMVKNKNIYLRGFGTFLVKKRAKKMARNISKKTTIIIPEHFVPTFKPSNEFMDKIKSKKV
jgi:DNA-binding protein HU-beta